jgi:hypothetical protein
MDGKLHEKGPRRPLIYVIYLRLVGIITIFLLQTIGLFFLIVFDTIILKDKSNNILKIVNSGLMLLSCWLLILHP